MLNRILRKHLSLTIVDVNTARARLDCILHFINLNIHTRVSVHFIIANNARGAQRYVRDVSLTENHCERAPC